MWAFIVITSVIIAEIVAPSSSLSHHSPLFLVNFIGSVLAWRASTIYLKLHMCHYSCIVWPKIMYFLRARLIWLACAKFPPAKYPLLCGTNNARAIGGVQEKSS